MINYQHDGWSINIPSKTVGIESDQISAKTFKILELSNRIIKLHKLLKQSSSTLEIEVNYVLFESMIVIQFIYIIY